MTIYFSILMEIVEDRGGRQITFIFMLALI